ncbi:MAG: hypothetical protein HYW85_06110 [Deltaproteobacteria bacterium]|nr:hypothetical protein [Deltaproteobacteria bacterium]MBI3016764.1 hypothetical protein [Deltaproteobacteria bacterium]
MNMKKNFMITMVSALLLSGCGMPSKGKPAKNDASSPPPQIKTEAAPPVVVEKPILPTLEPFDLIVHRVKDTVTIKIKKSVELPEGVKDHRLVIKRHKIGEEDTKTRYTVHIDVPLSDHPKAVIERQFDGRTSLHIEYPLTRINYDDKANIIAMQSDNNINGHDEMLGKYDPRTHEQLLRRIVVEQHDYDVKKEDESWSATITDAQRRDLLKIRKERRGENAQIEQEQEQLFAPTLYSPEIQAYLIEHELEWLTPQDITSISTYISISASDQPTEIIDDSEDSE